MIKLNAQIRVQRLAGKVLLIPSSSAGGPLQAKTVWPSHSEQVIVPDEDFYGLVSATVKPVPRIPACAVSVTGDINHIVEMSVDYGMIVSVTAEHYEAPKTHALYNGVRLPKIPEDVLAQYPYVWMNDLQDGTYSAIVAAQPWYYSSGKMYIPSVGENKKYTLASNTSEWVLDNSWTDNGGYTVTANLFWTSHDILNGSATATDIYFHGSEPVPTD